MPIVAAVAGIFVIAVAVKLGTTVGADAALMFRLLALGVLFVAALLALWLHHRRKSLEHQVERYHLSGDSLGYKQISLIGRDDARVCSECGAIVLGHWSLREHAKWHEQLAELLGGGEEGKPAVPWSAVTEPDAGGPGAVEVTAAEPEPEQVLSFREKYGHLMRR